MRYFPTVPRINSASPQSQGLVGWWPVTSQDRNSLINIATGDTRMAVGNVSHVGSEFRTSFDDGHLGIAVTGSYSSDEEFYRQSTDLSRYQITGDLTISMRFEVTSDVTQMLTAFGTAGESETQNYLWYIYREAGDAVQYIHEQGAGTNNTLTSTFTIAINTEYILTVRRDTTAKTIDFFLNDQEDLANSYPNNPTGGSAGTLNIANDGAAGNTPLQGKFCDVRIYDRALPLQVCRDMQDPVKRYDLYKEESFIFATAQAAAGGNPKFNGITSYTSINGVSTFTSINGVTG